MSESYKHVVLYLADHLGIGSSEGIGIPIPAKDILGPVIPSYLRFFFENFQGLFGGCPNIGKPQQVGVCMSRSMMNGLQVLVMTRT